MNITRLVVSGVLVLLSVSVFADTTAGSSKDGEELLKEIKVLFPDAGSRYPGRPGNLAIEKGIAERFAQSGLQHGEIGFEAPSFVPGRTRILVDGMPPVRLFPLHPTLFRPGNFPEREFGTKLVYLGRGTVGDLTALKGVPLDGAVALMEFNCSGSWQRFLRFGLKGFVFIGGDDWSHIEARTKIYATEVSVPRFLVGAAEGRRLKEAIKRSDRSLEVGIEAEPSRWRNVFLRDLWVLIPGSDAELKNEVCVFVAGMDSNCVVPEMATGGQSAANLHLLLTLLDEFAKRPPARSVILAAVNAHTQHYLGERMLAWHLLASGERSAAVRELMAADMRTEEFLQKAYADIQLDPPDKHTEETLIKMRTLVDESTGKKLVVKEPIVGLARRDVNQVKMTRLEIQRSDLSKDEKEEQFERANKLYRKHVNVLTLFNRVGIQTKLSDLSGNELEILKRYVTEIVSRNKAWAELNRRDLEIDVANSKIKDALAGRKVSVVIALDLAWRNDRIGFLSVSAHSPSTTSWPCGFGRRTTEIAASLAGRRTKEGIVFVDTMTNVGGLPQEYFFPGVDSANRFFHAAKLPAFSLRNVFVDGGVTFTPADAVDNLDGDLVARTTAYVPALLRAILSERDLGISTTAGQPTPLQEIFTIRMQSFSFDALAASVMAELPVPGSVVMLSHGGTSPLIGSDVVSWMFSLTDSRASRFFYGVDAKIIYSNAFHFDDDFVTVDHAIDVGEGHAQNTSNITPAPECRLVLFPCTEIAIYERSDSSVVSTAAISAGVVIPLGANRDAAPRKYGLSGIASPKSDKQVPAAGGPVAVFGDGHEPLKFLLGSNRLALSATKDRPTGEGFSSTSELGPDIFAAAAKDMSILNRHRLGEMRGVSDELAGDFVERGDEALAGVEAAREAADHIAYLQALYEALGCQTKAYGRIAALTNDMLKAIIVYMALLLPFCFFIQRLLFKFVKIEAEMAAFAVLFVVTFFVFRTIHPAFRVAQAPAAIFIAFVMGALGSFVIYILHSRFEGEMQMLFRAHLTMDASEVGYSTVGQKAMLIGVNNMKRRRIRTTLTTGTIVLVTFTMLAFSSISQRMNPTIVPVGAKPKYTGIFYQWPGGTRMDAASMEVLRNMFAGKGEIIVRRWLLPAARQQGITAFHAGCDTGRSMQVDAVLGLPITDNEFPFEMPLLPGSRFFSSDDAREVIVTASTAEALKIPPDRIGKATLTFQGHELTLVGLMDDEKLRNITDLNARSILPVKPTGLGYGQAQKPVTQVQGILPEDESGVFFVDTTALLIMPVDVAGSFGATPASIAVRFEDDAPIWSHVDQLLAATGAKFHVGSNIPFGVDQDELRAGTAGVYYVGSGYRTSIGGLTRLVIPLVIAATIILNTMLGSVYERKSEIAVYNAIGLNPTHIGLFFLAEALVYSVIGSVGGYLVGQTLAIALTKFEIITDLNLNFSSLSVAYVILVTIAIVLLSTLYPAVVATRAAIPSGKRRWSMPPHHGGRMEVVFPFVYQPPLAAGVMAYLAEYFSRFSEASMGDLIASVQSKTKGQDAGGRDTYGMSCHVALTPFDLGVTEEVTFRAAYDEVVKSHRVTMMIDRISGQDSNWVATNRSFLERLRKYLMNWRNLDTAEHKLYGQRAAESFLLGERE